MKKRKQAPEDGASIIVKKDRVTAFFVVRGTEQEDAFGPDSVFVEVGPKRTIAIQITQGDAIDMACMLLHASSAHLKGCPEHQEFVLSVLEDLGVLEKMES